LFKTKVNKGFGRANVMHTKHAQRST